MSTYLTEKRALWSPRTTARHLTSFRSYATYCGAPAGFLAGYRAPIADRPKPHPIPEGIPGVLAMLKTTRNPRHKALITLTGLMGLRVGEAISIRPEHFLFPDMVLVVRGKGDKTRRVPINATAWINLHFAYEIALARGTTLVDRGDRGARKAITRHAQNAGLGHVKSHDMRATLATAAYQTSGDIRAVQEILGHASVVTTQVYTNVTERDMRTALEVT